MQNQTKPFHHVMPHPRSEVDARIGKWQWTPTNKSNNKAMWSITCLLWRGQMQIIEHMGCDARGCEQLYKYVDYNAIQQRSRVIHYWSLVDSGAKTAVITNNVNEKRHTRPLAMLQFVVRYCNPHQHSTWYVLYFVVKRCNSQRIASHTMLQLVVKHCNWHRFTTRGML